MTCSQTPQICRHTFTDCTHALSPLTASRRHPVPPHTQPPPYTNTLYSPYTVQVTLLSLANYKQYITSGLDIENLRVRA